MEVPVRRNPGPSLGSEGTSGEITSVGGASSSVEGGRSETVPLAVLGGSTGRDDVLGREFRGGSLRGIILSGWRESCGAGRTAMIYSMM